MNLRVFTPTEVVIDMDVAHVTAEDPTGSLGIRPGHAALVTPLVPGIVTARSADGSAKYVAVNGGVMLVNADRVEIASRQATAAADLAHLENTVLAGFQKQAEQDKTTKTAFEKLRLDIMRRMVEFDRADES